MKPLVKISKITTLIVCMLQFTEAAAVLAPPTLTSPANNSTYNNFYLVIGIYDYTSASTFQFQYDTSSSFNSGFKKTITVTNKTYAVSEQLRKGKRYYCRARAINGTDTSNWCNSISCVIGTSMTLNKPSNLSTGPIDFIACANWNILDSTVQYLYQIDTSSSMNSSNSIYRKSYLNYYLDSQYFKFGRTIYWRATAINRYKDTLNWSSVYKYSFLSSPSILKVSSLTDPIAILGSTTIGYSETMIELDTTPLFNSFRLYTTTLPVGITQDTVKNLLFGRTYYYRLRAKFNNYLSNYSPTENFNVKGAHIYSRYSPYPNSTNNLLTLNLSWDRILGTKSIIQFSRKSDFSELMIDTLLIEKGILKTNDTLRLNTIYYWRIKTFHEKDTIQWTNLNFTTFKGEVSTISPANKAINQNINVKLVFSAMSAAQSYIVEIDTGVAFGSTLSLAGIRSTNIKKDFSNLYVDTILKFNTNYVWRVLAVFKNDTSANYFPKTFKTIDNPKLDYPVNNMIGAGTNVEGVFYYSNGPTSILWELDTSALFNSTLLKKGKDTNVLNNFFPNRSTFDLPRELEFETKYFWRIKWLSPVDTSKWSDVFNFTTTQIPWIEFPAKNSINLKLDTSIRWGVQGSVNDYIYQYQISVDSTFNNSPINALTKGTSSQKKLSNLSYNTKYFWRGRALHGKDTSSWSITSNFRTKSAPIVNKISLVSPPNLSKNVASSVLLRWLYDSSASSYDVQIASDTNMSNIIVTRNTTYDRINLTGLEKGTTYYWNVRGRLTANIVGAWSTVWRLSTAPSTNITANQISIFEIYPNPSNEIIIAKSQVSGTLKIYNTVGQEVQSLNIKEGENHIDVSRLTPATYTVKFESQLGISYSTIVIE